MITHAPKSLALLGTTFVALIAAVAVAAVMAQTDTDPKVLPPNPWADKSDAERQTDVDAAHKRNDDFLRAFVASNQDPRSLPVIEIPAYAAPLGDLTSSVNSADTILRGVVEATTFEINPSGGLPIMLSTVRVLSVNKGSAPDDRVVVRQLGGPVAQANGGAFARLDNDEPIFPGDDVLLFLQRASDGKYTTQPGTGVYFIRNERAYAEEANPFSDQISGLTVGEVVRSISIATQ